MDFLDEKYFKGQCQAYINYTNPTMSGLIQHFYDDHGAISPVDIEEREKNESIMVSTRPSGRLI